MFQARAVVTLINVVDVNFPKIGLSNKKRSHSDIYFGTRKEKRIRT